jgi:hypothetical protein
VSLHPLTFYVVDEAGNAIDGALVELEGAPDVFDDEAGTILVDPADRLTDDEGVFDCWAPAGVYRWRSHSGGISSQWRYVELAAGGAGEGDKNYVHNQSVLAASWSVAHNLGKYPAVEVVDSGGSLVLPDVVYVDVNHVQLDFASPNTGKAYVN